MSTIDLDKMSAYLVETLPKIKEVLQSKVDRLCDSSSSINVDLLLEFQYACNQNILLSECIHFLETPNLNFEEKTKAIDCVLKEFDVHTLDKNLLELFFEQSLKKAQEIKQNRECMRLDILSAMETDCGLHSLDEFKNEVNSKRTELVGGYTSTIVHFVERLNAEANVYQKSYIAKMAATTVEKAFCKAVEAGLDTYLKNAIHPERLALTSLEISKNFWLICPEIIRETLHFPSKFPNEEWQTFWLRFQSIYGQSMPINSSGKMKV